MTVVSAFSARNVDFTIYFYPQPTFTVKVKYIFLGIFSFDCLGGYREGETPGPIPNPEAKPLIADNTCPFRIGNVGRCLVDRFFTSLFAFYFTFAFLLNSLFYFIHYFR